MPFGFDINKIGKGLVSVGIPFVFKGTINEFLTERNVNIQMAVDWVKEDKDLLTLFREFGGGDFNDVLVRAHSFVSNADWLTSEYLIDSCREEHPDIASLFLGWEDARVWLDKNTEKLRQAFSQVAVQPPPVKVAPQSAPQHSADTPPASKVSELGAETTRIMEEHI
jgi:hypothetical protein